MEPSYCTRLEELIWGLVLVAFTFTIHGFGMFFVLHIHNKLQEWLKRAQSFILGMGIIIMGSWMIITIHLLEVAIWAGFFVWKEALTTSVVDSTYCVCYYFSLMNYTTLGCGYTMNLNWRLLAGMISISGLLAVAWSTAVLLTLVQEFQERELLRLKQRRKTTQESL